MTKTGHHDFYAKVRMIKTSGFHALPSYDKDTDQLVERIIGRAIAGIYLAPPLVLTS